VLQYSVGCQVVGVAGHKQVRIEYGNGINFQQRPINKNFALIGIQPVAQGPIPIADDSVMGQRDTRHGKYLALVIFVPHLGGFL
jgi:hypothetical protein